MRAFINRCLRFMAHLDSLSAVLGEKEGKMPNQEYENLLHCMHKIELFMFNKIHRLPQYTEGAKFVCGCKKRINLSLSRVKNHKT